MSKGRFTGKILKFPSQPIDGVFFTTSGIPVRLDTLENEMFIGDCVDTEEWHDLGSLYYRVYGMVVSELVLSKLLNSPIAEDSIKGFVSRLAEVE